MPERNLDSLSPIELNGHLASIFAHIPSSQLVAQRVGSDQERAVAFGEDLKRRSNSETMHLLVNKLLDLSELMKITGSFKAFLIKEFKKAYMFGVDREVRWVLGEDGGVFNVETAQVLDGIGCQKESLKAASWSYQNPIFILEHQKNLAVWYAEHLNKFGKAPVLSK